jgi:hypothetical protein
MESGLGIMEIYGLQETVKFEISSNIAHRIYLE